jgi:phosphoglycerate kinase
VNEAERQNLTAPDNTFGTIDDLDCRGRVVFLRVDPFVLDALADSRAVREEPSVDAAVVPDELGGAEPHARTSLERLLQLEARVIVGTHLSPEDKAAARIADIEELASGLSEQLGIEALVPDEPVGDATLRIIHGLRAGQICVLPDLLANPGEAKNDERFARALAQHVDAYVGDAFASSQLPFASIARLPRLVPRRALGYRAGLELEVASRLFASSRGSVAMVLGGSELGPRLGTVSAWLSRLDTLHVGGAAAVTLLSAAGRAPAFASTEPARLAEARSLLGRARDLDVVIRLPTDFWVELPGSSRPEVVAAKDLPAEARVIDIGPRSLEHLASALTTVTRLAWWGPLGHLARGGAEASRELAHICARPEVMSVVLGVETGRFVRQLPRDVRGGIDLVTTGTQAVVALLSGQRLPGLEALRR